jgi:charged multivesicular body protein 6
MQTSTIEFSLVQQSVLHGLKQGTSVLQELHKEMNIETVEKLLADTEDAREYQRASVGLEICCNGLIYSQEINELLSNRMTLEEEEEVAQELIHLQNLAVRCPLEC